MNERLFLFFDGLRRSLVSLNQASEFWRESSALTKREYVEFRGSTSGAVTVHSSSDDKAASLVGGKSQHSSRDGVGPDGAVIVNAALSLTNVATNVTSETTWSACGVEFRGARPGWTPSRSSRWKQTTPPLSSRAQ